MAETEQSNFEELWQQAQGEPEFKSVRVKNRITIDLSIENILDRYTNFASMAVTEHRISERKFRELKEHTKRFKKSLRAIDDGSLLGELKDLKDILNPFD